MKKILKLSSVYTLLFMPFVASAAMEGIRGIIQAVGDLVRISIPIVAGIALLVFFWGLAKFISKSGGDTGIEEGKNLMKWGIIALFVMVSIWGIVNFLRMQLGITDQSTPNIPTVQITR